MFYELDIDSLNLDFQNLDFQNEQSKIFNSKFQFIFLVSLG